jgi:hypothetical protein
MDARFDPTPRHDINPKEANVAKQNTKQAGCLRAKCAWKAKDPSQLGPEPAGYVRGE